MTSTVRKLTAHGSRYVFFEPQDDEADLWLRTNISADPQDWSGDCLAVGKASAFDTAQSIVDAGITLL